MLPALRRPRWAAAGLGLGPRRLRTARAWGAVILSVGTVAMVALSVLDGEGLSRPVIATAATLGVIAVLVPLVPKRPAAVLCVVAPSFAAGMIAFIDLVTHDAGVTGQVFFCLPVIYAATQLRVWGALTTTAVTVGAAAYVDVTLLPPTPAAVDLAYVGMTLVLMAVVLARAGYVNDRLVARLRDLAAVDPLTGLVTRRVLDDATETALGDVREVAGTAMVIVDVDHFKTVNDTYGHLVGDDALAHVAGVLTRSAREGDVVARMGGDELAVLLPACPYDVAVRRAEELVAAVHASPLPLRHGGVVRLSISAGVAHAPERASEPRDLYASADAALYEAKQAGRGRVGPVPAAG